MTRLLKCTRLIYGTTTLAPHHAGRVDHVHHLVHRSHQYLPRAGSQDLQHDERPVDGRPHERRRRRESSFFGYVLLQVPGGYFASRWSARKLISLCLIAWGIFAIGCGMSQTFRQFEVMRFFLGVAESGVFPATLVLLANWFPRSERARANAYWNLCQPLAVAGSAPFTGWLLGAYGWQKMIMLEGLVPSCGCPSGGFSSATIREKRNGFLRRNASSSKPN